jgi:hypothetical protein
MRWVRRIAVAMVGALLVACGGSASAPPAATAAATTAPATAAIAATPAPAATGTTDPKAQAVARPAFLTIPLTDVRTGERFTLGGFEGKVVMGIAMAVW